MKITRILGLFMLVPAAGFAQGALTPPGLPGPTMKTLTQVEPRTLISALPFFITNSGSYYLTGSLTGTPAQAGIVISAGNVSLDLNGFSISGSSNGISASGAGLSLVAVRNGTVQQCSTAGINLAGVSQCRIDHLLVCNNTGGGLSVGSGSVVDLCVAAGNAGIGIGADNGSEVINCVVQSNAADGITVSSFCRVAENNCDNNGSGANYAGIHATAQDNRIESNKLSRNNASGIKVDGTNNLAVKNSSCSNLGADYTIAAGNHYGQILTSPGPGFTNSNPWANFSCAVAALVCTTDANCPVSNYCSGGSCVPQLANGLACFASDQCLSGVCQTGSCQPGQACTIDSNCPTGFYCASGNCAPQRYNGQACVASDQCLSGLCQAGACHP
jgi:hypothetical protein